MLTELLIIQVSCIITRVNRNSIDSRSKIVYEDHEIFLLMYENVLGVAGSKISFELMPSQFLETEDLLGAVYSEEPEISNDIVNSIIARLSSRESPISEISTWRYKLSRQDRVRR